jgi:hypothetical protein
MCGGTRACCFFSVCVTDDAEGNRSANEALESRDCENCDATEGAREDDAEPALLTRIALLEKNESLAEMPHTLGGGDAVAGFTDALGGEMVCVTTEGRAETFDPSHSETCGE